MKRIGQQGRVISAENFELVHTYISYKNLISKIDPAYVKDEVKEKSSSEDISITFDDIEDAQFEEVTPDDMSRNRNFRSASGYGDFGRSSNEELNNIRYKILQTRELSDLTEDHYSPLERKRERFYQTHAEKLYMPKGGWYDSGP